MAGTWGEWLWQKEFWLPKINSWDDLVSEVPGVYYPQLKDMMLQTIVLGFLLLIFRYLYERFIVVPIALSLGIKHKRKITLEENPTLEECYSVNKLPKDEVIQNLCKKTSLSERQVQRWFRNRRNFDAPGKMKKFCECSWHFLFYCTSFWYGVWILWDKPWLWNAAESWTDYPKQHISDGIYYYYLFELGFYWSLVYSTMYDHKRKDFVEMIVHHIVTIQLMMFSWVCNFVRIGSLVLVAHDAADYWMAFAKMANYAKKEVLANSFFGVFVLVWIVSRLAWYPFWIIYSVWVDCTIMYGVPSYMLFLFLLCMLQVLHIIWSYMIARIIAMNFSDGKIKDVRSDTEMSEEEEKLKESKSHQDKVSKGNRLKHKA